MIVDILEIGVKDEFCECVFVGMLVSACVEWLVNSAACACLVIGMYE